MHNLFKIIAIIVILLGLIIAGIFISDKYSGKDQKYPEVSPQVFLPYNPSISDEKAVNQLVKNFISLYGNYQQDSFVSLKEAKELMTVRYREETAKFIEEREKANRDKPKEYITFSSVPTKININYLDSDKADVSVKIDFYTVYGAYLYLDGGLAQVDRFGEKTIMPLENEFKKKQAILFILKEDNLWKVDKIIIE